MQRGGLSIPPVLLSKGLPLVKNIGIPLAPGALGSIGDNVVDAMFGGGSKRQTGRKWKAVARKRRNLKPRTKPRPRKKMFKPGIKPVGRELRCF